MKERLRAGVEVWQGMPRNCAAELAAADAYFDTVLMPLAKEAFVGRYAQLAVEPYYGMVLTLGTSWQPLALSISALRPARIEVLATPETLPNLAQLKDFVKMPEAHWSVALVERGSSARIFVAMRSAHERWREWGRCCVDITGGTKAMAAAAAMMGALLAMDIYYVESRYLPLYRRPEPGSERLERLETPREYFERGAWS